MGKSSPHTDLGAVLTQTRASTMAPLVFLGYLWVYPTVLRTEHGPHTQWTRTHSTLSTLVLLSFWSILFQRGLPCVSHKEHDWPCLGAPLTQVSEHSWLIPIYTSAWTNFTPHPRQSEHQKEWQCPTAHLISGCTYMNSRKHVHIHTGVRGNEKRNMLNRPVPSIKVEETVQRGESPSLQFPSGPELSKGSQRPWLTCTLKHYPSWVSHSHTAATNTVTKATYFSSQFQRSKSSSPSLCGTIAAAQSSSLKP